MYNGEARIESEWYAIYLQMNRTTSYQKFNLSKNHYLILLIFNLGILLWIHIIHDEFNARSQS